MVQDKPRPWGLGCQSPGATGEEGPALGKTSRGARASWGRYPDPGGEMPTEEGFPGLRSLTAGQGLCLIPSHNRVVSGPEDSAHWGQVGKSTV